MGKSALNDLNDAFSSKPCCQRQTELPISGRHFCRVLEFGEECLACQLNFQHFQPSFDWQSVCEFRVPPHSGLNHDFHI